MIKNIDLLAILMACVVVFGSYKGHSIDQLAKQIKIGYPDIAHDMTVEEFKKRHKK